VAIKINGRATAMAGRLNHIASHGSRSMGYFDSVPEYGEECVLTINAPRHQPPKDLIGDPVHTSAP